MIRTFAILILALSCAQFAAAQGIRFGLEGGVNFSTIRVAAETPTGRSALEGVGGKFGGKAGAIAAFRMARSIFLEPGFFFSQKGYRDAADFYLRIDYLEVPLHLLYKRGDGNSSGLFLGAGPYVGYAVGGVDVSFGYRNTISRGDSRSDHVDDLDYGLSIVAGYEMRNHAFIRLAASGSLANILPDDEEVALGAPAFFLRNRVVSLSVGGFLNRRKEQEAPKQ